MGLRRTDGTRRRWILLRIPSISTHRNGDDGSADAEGNTLTITPVNSEDAPLWEALEQSAIGRMTTSVSTPFFAAVHTSRVAARWQRLREQWRAQPAYARMQGVGTIVVVAALVHLGLASIWRTVGYWWLIVPVTALMFGLTVMVLSRLGRSSR